MAVSEESSLRQATVLACVKLLSNSTAMLPLPVYRRIKRGKVREYSHPLYPLLQEQANPEMGAFETPLAHAGRFALGQWLRRD